MTELDWRRLEDRLAAAHRAATPPVPPRLWAGVEAALHRRRRPRWPALAVAVVVAAALVLWLVPSRPPAPPDAAVALGSPAPTTARGSPAPATALGSPAIGSSRSTTASPSSGVGSPRPATGVDASQPGSSVGAPQAGSSVGAAQPASAIGAAQPALAIGASQPGSAVGAARAAGPPREGQGEVLNQVLIARGARTFVMAVDAGRIEVEPCRGRFVNVAVLGSPHRQLALRERGARVEVELDGGALRGGVAHVLVPADTHLVLTSRSGDVVVRGLGGAIEITTDTGAVHVDTAPRLDPIVTLVSARGALAWRGRCGAGCRVDARSQTGDVTLRAPDRSAFATGRARGASGAGHVSLEELVCSEPGCASPPLPWRQAAAGH
jgi:hypothetical protein